MTNRSEPIFVEQTFAVSRSELWDAITDPEQMQQWFFKAIPDMKASVGFETSFQIQSNERTFTHLWKILVVMPQEKIVYDWRYEEYDGDGRVTFEISESNGSSLLRVTSEGLETFPEGIPEFTRDAGFQGWEYFINGSLFRFIHEGAGEPY